MRGPATAAIEIYSDDHGCDIVADEQRVLAQERHDAEGPLADVVVQRDLGVVEEDPERLLLVEGVGDRLAER